LRSCFPHLLLLVTIAVDVAVAVLLSMAIHHGWMARPSTNHE
jgi:hypothetical protein